MFTGMVLRWREREILEEKHSPTARPVYTLITYTIMDKLRRNNILFFYSSGTSIFKGGEKGGMAFFIRRQDCQNVISFDHLNAQSSYVSRENCGNEIFFQGMHLWRCHCKLTMWTISLGSKGTGILYHLLKARLAECLLMNVKHTKQLTNSYSQFKHR